MKGLKEFEHYLFDIDYERDRRIKIAEFKLGIHDPESRIIDVDLMGNPYYSGWYFGIHTGEYLFKAFVRPGKTSLCKMIRERYIRELINKG